VLRSPALFAGEAIVTAPDVVVRTAPFEVAPELGHVHAGDKLWADDQPLDAWRRVRLPDGRFGLVHDVDIKVTVMAPPPKPPVLLVQPASVTLAGPGSAFVEVRTTATNVRIDRVAPLGVLVPVCLAPCRKVLPGYAAYVIGGDGVAARRFYLPPDKQRVTLDVRAESTGSAQAAGGVALVVIGSLTSFVGADGALFTALGDFEADRGRSLAIAGSVMLGGLVMLGLGAYLVHTAKTDFFGVVNLSQARPQARKRGALALTPRGLEF
jgi:hypothetical protein